TRSRPAAPRGRRRPRPALGVRLGPPATMGRWSTSPERSADQTRRLHAIADHLLERYGLLTPGAGAAGPGAGGLAASHPVLRAFEDSGRCRRGYFVEGLGAAQFALPGAVDRMRSMAAPARPGDAGGAVVLAANDPANPYGAALGWPAHDGGHRPGRKAGA